MVGLETIRASNTALKKINGLVAVFVGGTSGIGEYTLKQFVKHTISPRVYIVGRSEKAAKRIADEAKQLNAEGTISFIQSDVSLLRNVDQACRELQAKEERINLLFMTPGFLSTGGRNETSEGLDKKLALNYYVRMRFATNLLPQLTAAASSPSSSSGPYSRTGLSRIVTVLGPGRGEGNLIADDLGLRTHFSLSNCEMHAVTMADLFLEELVARNPRISCVHAFPGIVKSNMLKNMGGLYAAFGPLLLTLMRPWLVPAAESGERHLYAATAETFAPREEAKGREDAAVGSDGEKGSGAYLVNEKSDKTGKDAVLKELRSKGMREKVWEHTMAEFERISKAAESG